jgi:hypothetical protein
MASNFNQPSPGSLNQIPGFRSTSPRSPLSPQSPRSMMSTQSYNTPSSPTRVTLPRLSAAVPLTPQIPLNSSRADQVGSLTTQPMSTSATSTKPLSPSLRPISPSLRPLSARSTQPLSPSTLPLSQRPLSPRSLSSSTSPLSTSNRPLASQPLSPSARPLSPRSLSPSSPSMQPSSPSMRPLSPRSASPSMRPLSPSTRPLSPRSLSPRSVSPRSSTINMSQSGPIMIPVVENLTVAETLPVLSESTVSSSDKTSPLRSERVFKTPDQLKEEVNAILSSASSSSVKSVEEMLLNHDYVVTDRILTTNPSGELESHYLKARNSRGQTVYIDLDQDGFVRIQPNDVTLIKSEKAAIIPHSVKLGMLKCAGTNVCGIAFECSNGLCTLIHKKDDMEPVETNLIMVEDKNNTAIIESGQPVAYPVVRLSELLENPKTVMAYVDTATNSLLTISLKICKENINSIEKSLYDTNKKYQNLKATLNKNISSLANVIVQLETMRAGYDRRPPQSNEEKERFHILSYNLQLRYELVHDLTRKCGLLGEYKDTLENLNVNFDNMTEFLNNTFKNLESVQTK